MLPLVVIVLIHIVVLIDVATMFVEVMVKDGT